MKAEIVKEKDENKIPYVELRIEIGSTGEDYSEGDVLITFRKYPKRVFVGVEDNRDNPFSGADLDDCWFAPIYIIERIPRPIFDPYQSFIRALRYLGVVNSASDIKLYHEDYNTIKAQVEEWRLTEL